MSLGIALGGGGARGWVHVGVLLELQEMGIEPDIFAGSSAGSLVSAAWLTNQIEELYKASQDLSLTKIASIADLTLRKGGLFSASDAVKNLDNPKTNIEIKSLPKKFGAVSMAVATGKEAWLLEGNLMDAVEASTAIPGLFTPVEFEDGWYVDGSMANPVPVDVARFLGAQKVIAVSLMGPYLPKTEPSLVSKALNIVPKPWKILTRSRKESSAPSLLDVTMNSILATQYHLSKARLAQDKPDILIEPDLSDIGILEFSKAEIGIERGRQAVKEKAAEIRALLQPVKQKKNRPTQQPKP